VGCQIKRLEKGNSKITGNGGGENSIEKGNHPPPPPSFFDNILSEGLLD